MGFSLPKLKVPTALSDKMLGIQATIADKINLMEQKSSESLGKLLEPKQSSSKSAYMLSATLGMPGAGKTELLCFFDDFSQNLDGKGESCRSGTSHSTLPAHEVVKSFVLPRLSFDGLCCNLIVSDAPGIIDATDARFRQIGDFIEKSLASSALIMKEAGKIPFLCFYAVNLNEDLSDRQTQYTIRATWRLFKRRVIDRIYGRAKLRIQPKMIVVGTHLDEIKRQAESAGETDGAEMKISELKALVKMVAEKEGYSMHCPCHVIVADLYSADGRREFNSEILECISIGK